MLFRNNVIVFQDFNRRVQYQDVDGTKRLRHLGGKLGRGTGDVEIGRETPRTAAACGDRLCNGSGVATLLLGVRMMDSHTRPLGGECDGDGTPNAAPRPGYQRRAT